MNYLSRSAGFCALALCFITSASNALAQPWIEAGDQRVRHHLQTLADADHIDLPLTTWPLMWRSVKQALNDVDTAGLESYQLQSYRYLQHELQRAERQATSGAQFSANTSHYGLTDFGEHPPGKWRSQTYGTYTASNWAFKVQGAVVGDPIDGQRYQLDGSYLAATAGNWVIGVGAVDRWWGPGWQSSLILSNAARPAPGVFVNRAGSEAFDLPVLEWLGPWGLQVFLNQLESDRSTSDAKLFGMRVSFQPLSSLELGLSRTAQWGGEGRPEDWVSIRRTLLGISNRGADGIAQDGSNEPANQLAGYDWRWSQTIGSTAGAFYGQLIGEDEANWQPYKFIGLAGVEAAFAHRSVQTRLAVEISNTTMEFEDDGTPNVAYEHPRYRSGYRYRGRPLGASTDNDSELVVLKGMHYFANFHSFSWTLGSGNINIDGTNTSFAAGGNALAAHTVDLQYAKVRYTLPVGRKGELAFGAQYYSEPLSLREESIESGVSISYSLRLDQRSQF